MTKIDLSPGIVDLVLYAGDGADFRLIFTDKDGEPVPLTGEMEAQIRIKRLDADPPSAEFTIDLGVPEEGIALLSLTGLQTQALAPETKFKGVWDLQWTAEGSQPRTLCQGKVECLNDVSR